MEKEKIDDEGKEKKKFKIEKQTIVVIVLAVLLVGVLGYVGVGKWNESKQQEQLEIFQQGAQYGYEQAVLQVMGVASSCNAVPLRDGNLTMDVVAVDCLAKE